MYVFVFKNNLSISLDCDHCWKKIKRIIDGRPEKRGITGT